MQMTRTLMRTLSLLSRGQRFLLMTWLYRKPIKERNVSQSSLVLLAAVEVVVAAAVVHCPRNSPEILGAEVEQERRVHVGQWEACVSKRGMPMVIPFSRNCLFIEAHRYSGADTLDEPVTATIASVLQRCYHFPILTVRLSRPAISSQYTRNLYKFCTHDEQAAVARFLGAASI